MESSPTLVQFRFSHFNEKARWALDYKEVPHHRRTLLPGLHERAARKLTGGTVVPILLVDGQVVADSTAIIAALEKRHPTPALVPEDAAERNRALELEDFFDEEVGPDARHAMFYLGIDDAAFVAGLFGAHLSWPARLAYQGMLRVGRSSLKRDLKLTPEEFEKSRAKVLAGLDRLESEIGPAGYLVGDRFSVADLAAAALLSPLAQPDEYPHPPGRPYPAAIQDLVRDLERPRAFDWVRGIYRKHRPASAAVSGI